MTPALSPSGPRATSMRYTARRDSWASAASALTTCVDFIFRIISKYRDKSMTAGLDCVYAASTFEERSGIARGARQRHGSRHDPPRRKTRGESAALARIALDVERCLVPAQHVLDDREPEPGAAGGARAAAIDAVKTLGQPRNVLGRDADARIDHGEFRLVGRGAPGDAHLAAVGRVANGVGHQVAKRARDLALGAEQIEPRFGLQQDAMLAAAQCHAIDAQPFEQRHYQHPLIQRRGGG